MARHACSQGMKWCDMNKVTVMPILSDVLAKVSLVLSSFIFLDKCWTIRRLTHTVLLLLSRRVVVIVMNATHSVHMVKKNLLNICSSVYFVYIYMYFYIKKIFFCNLMKKFSVIFFSLTWLPAKWNGLQRNKWTDKRKMKKQEKAVL